MCTSIQLQRRSVRSQSIASDVFERASLCILRRYQQAATRSAGTGQDGEPTPRDTRERRQETVPRQE